MKAFVRIASASAIIVASAALPGCDSCADVGCVPNVTITPEEPLSESGQYEVDFVADGESVSCSVKVPSTAPPKCTDDRAYVYQERGRGILWLSLDGKLANVSVTVTRDGTSVADQSFDVSYEDAAPAAGACTTCPAASESLKINQAM